MNVLPAIIRELRSEARNPHNHWTRPLVGLVAGVILFGAFFSHLGRMGMPPDGSQLFPILHRTVFVIIWVVAPLLTADCLSRERRENTLGLLCLTPLRPAEIALAKGFIHSLRAVTFLMAVVPIVSFTLFLGGLCQGTLVNSMLINASALCCALAAGLLASVRCEKRGRAFALSLCFSLGFLLLFLLGFDVVSTVLFPHLFAPYRAMLFGNAAVSPSPSLFHYLLHAFDRHSFSIFGDSCLGYLSSANSEQIFGGAFKWIAPMESLVLHMLIPTFAVSLTVYMLVLWVAGRSIRRHWQQQRLSPQLQKLEQIGSRPLFGTGPLRGWVRWWLNHHPTGWLEQRTWGGRMNATGWVAAVIAAFLLVLSIRKEGQGFSVGYIEWIALGFLVAISFTTDSGFRHERETGMMELLLISPLRPGRIIRGRLLGIWIQFLPALLLLGGLWFVVIFAQRSHYYSYGSLLFCFISVLCMPVMGLYLSVAERRSSLAALKSLALGVVLPVVLSALVFSVFFSGFAATFLSELGRFDHPGRYDDYVLKEWHGPFHVRFPDLGLVCWGGAALLQLALTALIYHRLRQRLEQRRFPVIDAGGKTC